MAYFVSQYGKKLLPTTLLFLQSFTLLEELKPFKGIYLEMHLLNGLPTPF